MNKKIILLSLSYLFAVLSAYMAYLIFDMTELSHVYIIFNILILLFSPFFIYKYAKPKSISKELEMMFFYLFMFIIPVTIYIFMLSAYNSMNNLVAYTESKSKAEEIQSILTTKDRPTTREIIQKADDKIILYGIGLHRFNKEKHRKAVIELLNSPILDDSVHICLNYKYSRNPKNVISRLEEEIEWIIWDETKNLEWIDTNIYSDIPIDNLTHKNFKNAKVEKITVDFGINDDAYSIKIKNDITKLLSHTFDNKDNHIKIIVNNYNEHKYMLAYNMYSEAEKEFLKKNYDKSLHIIKKASSLNNSYENVSKYMQKLVNINEKIAKNPNNYKYYIERADVLSELNHEFTHADIQSTLDDYNKALELNPKACEIYEKRGNARTNIPSKYRNLESDSLALADYLKAVELLGGNDNLYENIGHIFEKTNPQEAVNYFNKIKHYKSPIPICSDYKNKLSFNWDTYCYVPIYKIKCYDKLKQYDNALNIVESMPKNIDYNRFNQQTNNMKFYYNWKAGHYKEALKNADNCSAWVCQLVGIFF